MSFEQLCEPGFMRLPIEVRYHHVAMKTWCAAQHTDGFFPDVAIRLVPGAEDPDAAVAQLVELGLWTPVAGGWKTSWAGQMTAERAKRIKLAGRTRKERFTETRERHAAEDHSMCRPDARCRNGEQNAVSTLALTESERVVPDLSVASGDAVVRNAEGRRSGARLVEAAALTPPRKGRARKQDPSPVDYLALIHALRTAHIGDRSARTAEQKLRLTELLPSGSVDSSDILDVLRFALGFEGRELKDVDAGTGQAIIAAGERLGAAGFPARWAETAANLRAIHKPIGRGGSQVGAEAARR